MRRKSREINVFNMSALDLFASALGAFIVIAVVLFPYYLKNGDIVNQLRQSQHQLSQCQAQNKSLQQQLNQANQAQAKCLKNLAQTYLAVVMKWPTEKHDVDLHVIDPDGNEFYYSKHNRSRSHFSTSNAELSVDTKKGPGIEIWEQPNAKPGTYKILYRFFARKKGVRSTTVSGNLYFREGMRKLPTKTLSSASSEDNNKVLVATVILNEQGEVSIR